jgi:hypothetical protein
MSKMRPFDLYRGEPRIWFLHPWKILCRDYAAGTAVVEPVGIEPTTSSLQS